MAVIGFDNLEESARIVPPLTTVDQPSATIGSAAASLLLSALHETHQNVIDVRCTLVERDSA
jgi:DNA-binding LacI/PurR family transcriptional regulator